MLRGGTEFGALFNNPDEHFNIQATAGELRFHAFGSLASGGLLERMRITSVLQNDNFTGINHPNTTRVTISYGNAFDPVGTSFTPWSMLHIGREDSPFGIRRDWMNVGTSYLDNRDAMYVGLAVERGDDRTDAIIAWADNAYPEAGPDNLRFVFLAAQNPLYGLPGTRAGLETGRFSPDGNFGVGDFYNPGIQPLRRVEILDMRRDEPQLRLTHTQNANINLGIHTDFQTTAAGNLFINPRRNGVNRFVGINTNTPGNTLEINSTAGVSPRPSGLRFRNLNSNSANDIAPNGRVLTVDQNGDVVLTDDDNNHEKIAMLIAEISLLNNRLNEIEKLLSIRN
jgi:hypothetical protein